MIDMSQSLKLVNLRVLGDFRSIYFFEITENRILDR